jgi:hypothetical protein
MELEHVHGGEAGLVRERRGGRITYREADIDPRVIREFEEGSVIGLPEGLPQPGSRSGIDACDDGVIIEVPTDREREPCRSC